MRISDLHNIDIVLLSHHQHKDNFDTKGKELALTVPTIISTKPASKAIQGITGLDDWESYSIQTPRLNKLKVTATPAQHHPWWVPEFLAGKVIGFIIEFDGQENGAIYISGDTVYFKGIDEIAKRFKIDIGIFHVGSVQFRYLTGFGHYTMDSKDLVKSVRVLNPHIIIPVHYKGWSHFKEKEEVLRNTISENVDIENKILFLTSGIPTPLL